MHHDTGIQYVAPLESFPLDKWDAILGPFRWKRCDGALVCATESGSPFIDYQADIDRAVGATEADTPHPGVGDRAAC